MDNAEYQVFISYKYHGKNDEILPDYYMAKKLYEELTKREITTFFSDHSIAELASSDYKKLIDSSLDCAKILVVVATEPSHCESNWVRYEWDSFYNDILSGQKDGCLISYLDTEDIRKFPRTIRNLQAFKQKENGLNSILEFICSYFGKKTVSDQSEDCKKGSSYNYEGVYELGNEKKRLEIQGKLESVQDKEYLQKIFKNRKDNLKVLDVGCSTGAVTFDVLGSLPNVEVLGVDKFQKCVDEFNDLRPTKRFYAEYLNFEDSNWEKQLSHYMQIHNIEKFDLVYCSLSLHHMSDSEAVVKKLWQFINDDGYIYVRTCDDGLKIAYPNEKIIFDIVNKTLNVSRISDRLHGRKIFSILQHAKFKDIRIIPVWNDTSNKTIDERYALFYAAFVWRKNYFRNSINDAKNHEEIEKAMSEYDEVTSILDQIEDLFSDTSFYFGHGFIIAYAQKRRIF
jgi:2-polyprenyl-3-methyl-5-hydroxy-6-metoxy-1,4-benzoquinol methylase